MRLHGLSCRVQGLGCRVVFGARMCAKIGDRFGV